MSRSLFLQDETCFHNDEGTSHCDQSSRLQGKGERCEQETPKRQWTNPNGCVVNPSSTTQGKRLREITAAGDLF